MSNDKTNWSDLSKARQLKDTGGFFVGAGDDLSNEFYDVGNEVYGDMPVPNTGVLDQKIVDNIKEMHRKMTAQGFGSSPICESAVSPFTEEQIGKQENHFSPEPINDTPSDTVFDYGLPDTEQNIPVPKNIKAPKSEINDGHVAMDIFAKKSGRRQMIVALLSNEAFIASFVGVSRFNGSEGDIDTKRLVSSANEIVDALNN